MNLNFYPTKDYENKHNWTLGQNKPNSNPIAERVKLMQSVYLQRITEKTTISQSEKTNPISEKSKNERKRFFTKGL